MSLSENLHNLGALMKTNLETKGINGLTGNEGLTTLANKILDIEGSGSSSKSIVAHVTGNNITLGPGGSRWLNSIGNVVIEWGDGTSDIVNNPSTSLSHTYADGLNEHLIIFRGTVTSLEDECFRDCSGLTSIIISDSVTTLGTWCFYNCSGLTSVFIPDSVTTLKSSCFDGCSGLTSIIIPDSVTDLRTYCFYECSSLIDYKLYWETQPIPYDSEKMPVNNDTVFTIPYGTTSIYIAVGYPSDRLVERAPPTLTLTCDKPIIQKTETSTVTATLQQSGSPLTGKTLNYQVKHGNTVISSGTKTTNSSGQATISYVGTGVGDVSVEVTYGTLLQETYELEDTIAYSDCTNNSIENIIDVPSNVKNSTYEFSATGWKYGNVSPYTNMLLQSSISLSKPTLLSLKVIENSSNGLSFNIGKSGNNWIYLSIENGGLIYNGNRLKAPVMGAEYTVKVFSDKIEIYENDTLLYTDNITLTEWYVALGTGTNRYVRIKDFKIKAL